MVLPFIGAGIATGIGTLAGLSLGPYIFSALTKPTSYYLLREEVDNDHKVPAPEPGLLVQTQYRNALPLLEPWVTDPDYERTSMINRLTATVWPTMTKAIIDMIVQGDVYNTVLYPQLQAQVFSKYAFVEDIFLGPHSLKHGKIDLKLANITFKVTIIKLNSIRGGDDLYVRSEVRKGRTQQTRTIDNCRDPVFNEEFSLIVDSFKDDVLKLQVWRDDMGWQDTLLSEVEVPFRNMADFVKETKTLTLKLRRYRKNRASRLFTLKKKPKELPPAALSGASDSELQEGPAAVPSGRIQTMGRAPSMGRSGSAIGGDAVVDAKEECGTITVKLTFIPFNKPEYDDIQAEREVKSKVADPYRSMFPAPPGRTLALMGDGGGGAASPLSTTSTVIVNETSPRWGDKFDFVLIPSNSELHIQVIVIVTVMAGWVFNKQGMLGNLVGSLFNRKKEDKDPILGKVLIRVEDVARNGRIKETWSLQDAERGYIELNLIWQTCHVSRNQL
eukprot:XP_001702810.1 predicted protein [Chlamydomonas reinhardtii]